MKVPGIVSKLKPQQEAAIKKAMEADTGIILDHSVGSGKTLSAIAIANAYGKEADVIVPASLIENFKEQVAQHTNDKSVKFNIYSLQDLARSPEKFMQLINNPDHTLIVDEAHRLRNEKSKSYETIKNLAHGKKILLTGTPLYNRPSDLTNLLEILNKDDNVHHHMRASQINRVFGDFDKNLEKEIEKKIKYQGVPIAKSIYAQAWNQARRENSQIKNKGLLVQQALLNQLEPYYDQLDENGKKNFDYTKSLDKANPEQTKYIAIELAKKHIEEKMRNKYYGNKEHQENTMKYLIDKYVHHYEIDDQDPNFAIKETETDYIPMTRNQAAAYKSYYDKLPENLRAKIEGNTMEMLPPSTFQNPFFVYTREFANVWQNESPKIEKMVDDIKKAPGKVLSYSNFLNAGVKPLAERLEFEGIPYAIYTGEMTKAQKNKIIDDYNNDRIKTLIVSSAGGEGLNLKKTRLVQIMEPHWNREKINQVIGRAIRFKSHEDLPEEERIVKVKNYVSVLPKATAIQMGYKDIGDYWNNTTDSYLNHLSNWKQDINKPIKEIVTKFGQQEYSGTTDPKYLDKSGWNKSSNNLLIRGFLRGIMDAINQ